MNRTLYADDCLNVLNDQLALPNESVDLIYLDPPFNSKSQYNLPFKGEYKSATPVMAFKDTWQWGDTEDAALNQFESGPAMRSIADIVKIARRMDGPNTRYSLAAYLVNMAQRLIPMRRVLKSTGTIYLHCDTTASHYIKIMMDVIFRHGNFGNEIVWHYKRWPAGDRHFQRMHDTILRFQASPKFKFNVQFQPYSGKTIHRRMSVDGTTDLELSRDESRGTKMDDVWYIPYLHSQSKERLGYPTQKPLALLERIIQASTNRGDVVLDPFCGCGTAINAAARARRNLSVNG